jgi:hypothetical protein
MSPVVPRWFRRILSRLAARFSSGRPRKRRRTVLLLR